MLDEIAPARCASRRFRSLRLRSHRGTGADRQPVKLPVEIGNPHGLWDEGRHPTSLKQLAVLGAREGNHPNHGHLRESPRKAS
jgi:hypothetical protein